MNNNISLFCIGLGSDAFLGTEEGGGKDEASMGRGGRFKQKNWKTCLLTDILKE